jgi:nitrogen regulatory protein P-II 1
MKRIDAVIRPERLDAVKERLASIGVQGATAAEVRGFGRQRGHTEMYRGTEYSVDFLPKILLTIVTSDELVDQIVDAIIEGGRTGKFGDGKIFVTALDEVIRIRTGERGDASL